MIRRPSRAPSVWYPPDSQWFWVARNPSAILQSILKASTRILWESIGHPFRNQKAINQSMDACSFIYSWHSDHFFIMEQVLIFSECSKIWRSPNLHLLDQTPRNFNMYVCWNVYILQFDPQPFISSLALLAHTDQGRGRSDSYRKYGKRFENVQWRGSASVDFLRQFKTGKG